MFGRDKNMIKIDHHTRLCNISMSLKRLYREKRAHKKVVVEDDNDQKDKDLILVLQLRVAYLRNKDASSRTKRSRKRSCQVNCFNG